MGVSEWHNAPVHALDGGSRGSISGRILTPPLRPVKYHEPGRYLWSSDSCVFLKVVGSLQTVKTLFGKKV